MAVQGRPESLTAQAVVELRDVAAFLHDNAEALIGDLDSTYVLDEGIRVSFRVLEKDSIPTVGVEKEHIAWRGPSK